VVPAEQIMVVLVELVETAIHKTQVVVAVVPVVMEQEVVQEMVETDEHFLNIPDLYWHLLFLQQM
tara:strand:- start:1286 stop:1480 length:195 start_codon:yes stop_codon:yes gene_type:complete